MRFADRLDVSFERLARVRLQVTRDFGSERLAEFGALLFAHPGNAFHGIGAIGIVTRHRAERVVAKNDVRRHLPLVGELLAQRAQPLEQDLVARDVAFAPDATRFAFGRSIGFVSVIGCPRFARRSCLPAVSSRVANSPSATAR